MLMCCQRITCWRCGNSAEYLNCWPSALPCPLPKQMLLETLRWRAEYQPQALHWDSIKHEGARGKLFVLDQPDNDGRPVVIMRPR